jgi:hypothetical protein
MRIGLLDIETRGSNIIWHNSICVEVGIRILSDPNESKSDPAFTDTYALYVEDHLIVSPEIWYSNSIYVFTIIDILHENM